jgi:hypothetical protein
MTIDVLPPTFALVGWILVLQNSKKWCMYVGAVFLVVAMILSLQTLPEP